MATSPDNVSTMKGLGGTQVPSPPAVKHGPLGPKDNAEVLQACAGHFDRIIELESERKGVNDRIGAEKEAIRARGFSTAAINGALQFRKMNADKRKGYDSDLAVLRKAQDLPIQPSLLDEEPEDSAPIVQ